MKTPVVLLIVHAVAFVLLFAGHIVPQPVGNAIVAIGLCVEFPGYMIANSFGLSNFSPAWFAFIFCLNGIVYFSGGLVIDKGTRAPRS